VKGAAELENVVAAWGSAEAASTKPAVIPDLKSIFETVLTQNTNVSQEHGKLFLYNIVLTATTRDPESMTSTDCEHDAAIVET
jgi:hypothetical protein